MRKTTTPFFAGNGTFANARYGLLPVAVHRAVGTIIALGRRSWSPRGAPAGPHVEDVLRPADAAAPALAPRWYSCIPVNRLAARKKVR